MKNITFPKWGMLPACRIKQLLVHRKLEAYATYDRREGDPI